LSLDPDTGKEEWSFDPEASSPSWQRCRGLGYYEAGTSTTGAECIHRLFLPTNDARLIALDADTGKPCAGFGTEGTVDLSGGMGRLEDGWYKQTSPPLVAENLVIVGGRIDDTTNETPGVVRAFDV